MFPVFCVGAILLTLLVCKIIHGWIFKEGKLIDIPGPKGWPLVGNSLQMDPINPHKTLSDWSKKYGDMFKIKIFKDEAVVLNDYEGIRHMLNSEACSSRPYMYRFNALVFNGMRDLILQNFSDEWNDKKKALSRSMNAYGTGSMKIESITLECIDKFFVDIQKDTKNFSESIDIRPYLHMRTADIITTLFYGRRLNESELMELVELERGLSKLSSAAGIIAVLDIFPWMRYLPIKDIQGPMKDGIDFRKWVVDRQNERNLVPVRNGDCILDSMMGHVNKVTSKVMTESELIALTINLVSAGFSTSTAALYSLILVLINYPKIQEKMYEEIQNVTNGTRPKVSDRKNMVYVRAVMEENFRYSTITPLGLPHFSGEATTINGKHIPKGVTLLANFWRLHHNERYFDEPWKFKPERFLKENGEMIESDNDVWKHSMPFSAGRRICPGEGLARSRIFLIMANLLQKYKFLPGDECDIPSCDPRKYDSGIVVLPFKYKIKVMER